MNTAPCRFAAFAILISASFAQSAIADAVPTVVVDELTISATGATQAPSVDVWVDLSEPAAGSIAGFQLELALVGPDNSVTFTGVGAPVSHPYLFANDSAAPLFLISDAGRRVTVGDFLDSGLKDILDGRGLASLQLSVQPQALGKTYEIHIDHSPAHSFLAVDTTHFVPFSADNGKITVVPEPMSIAWGLPCALVWLRHRNKRRLGVGASEH